MGMYPDDGGISRTWWEHVKTWYVDYIGFSVGLNHRWESHHCSYPLEHPGDKLMFHYQHPMFIHCSMIIVGRNVHRSIYCPYIFHSFPSNDDVPELQSSQSSNDDNFIGKMQEIIRGKHGHWQSSCSRMFKGTYSRTMMEWWLLYLNHIFPYVPHDFRYHRGLDPGMELQWHCQRMPLDARGEQLWFGGAPHSDVWYVLEVQWGMFSSGLFRDVWL